MASNWAEQTSNLVEHNSILSDAADLSPEYNGGQNDKVKWTYVKLRGGMTIIEPVMGFYRNPPPLAQCRWTTNNGQQKPIMFEKDILKMPSRTLTKWNDEQLAAEARKYQELYWEEMKSLVRPESFEDLYEYFDSMTLWMNGAYNMWNLVNMLVTHAHNQMPLILQEWKQAIEAYVYDFFYNHPYAYYNRQALCQWNGVGDPINSIAFQNWPNFDLDGLNLEQENMAREALISQYIYLTGKQVDTPQYYPFFPRPVVDHMDASRYACDGVAPQPAAMASATTSSSSEPQGAARAGSGATTAKPVVAIGQPAAGRTTSPSATLTSIPEEPTAVKAIDAPTSSASLKAAAPKIVTKEATPERAEIIRDRKDSNGSTDKLFFNPSPDRLQVEGRSLSIMSAPDQEPEPMFDNAGAGAAKRCASEAPAVMKIGYENGHANVPAQEAAGQATATVNTRRTSWQAPHKSSAHFGPIQQGPSGEVQQHRTPNQVVQYQGQPMMGPSPPRPTYAPHHPQSSFGPPNVMMPPPPGPFPGPNGFFPGGPPFPPSVETTPAGRPSESFQSQVPARPPPYMDQPPQFGNPQGPPMNMPPHFMGPPNQGPAPNQCPPMYQPNGYVPQTPKHNGSQNRFDGPGDNRNHNKKTSGRRDSVVSSGSRKVRDDPIHGAVYALKGTRKGGNFHSGLPPSNGHDLEQESGNNGIVPPCNNAWAQGRYEDLFSSVFNECPCRRCAEATRSLFIALRVSTRIETHDMRNALMKHFAKFGPVSVKRKQNVPQALVIFQNDVDAIRAIQDACSSGEKTIKNLGVVGRVWYPLFSKHYTPSSFENPTGQPKQLFEVQSQMRLCDTRSRRESNPFRSQQQPTGQLHRRSFTGGPQGPVEHGFPHPPPAPNMGQLPPSAFPAMDGVVYPPMGPIPPRTLWEPPASPTRQPSLAISCAKVEQERVATHQFQKTGQRTAEILMKEDWRSKPPSEEAITDDSDDLPRTETASNHSSQGSRSVKVSLPNEEGSAREAVSRDSSRSTSPEVGKQLPKDGKKHLKNKKRVHQEREAVQGECGKASAASSQTITPKTAKAVGVEKDKAAQETRTPKTTKNTRPKEPTEEKTSPGSYRKTTADLAAPVESVEQLAAKSGYRKTTVEISSAVEKVDYPMETVIRHKQPRRPLPREWAADMPGARESSPAKNTFASTGIKERFASINEELHKAEMASAVEKVSAALPSSANAAPANENAAPSTTDSELAAQPQQTQTQRKKSKNKKGGKALGGKSNPASRSHTPMNAHSRAPSSGSNRPPSAAALVDATTSRGPSPAMQNNNDASAIGAQEPKKKTHNKNKKRKPTQSASDLSEGLAKSGGCQDTKDQEVFPGSPMKKCKTADAGPAELVGKDAESPPNSKLAEHIEGHNNSGYRSNNGGSLRMNKQRTPKAVEQKNGLKDEEETERPIDASTTCLPIIFEPPTKEDTKDVSPDAKLFAHQKFTIDQTRKSSNMPKTQIDSASASLNNQPMQVNSRVPSGSQSFHSSTSQPKLSGAWAAIVKGDVQSGKTDDPFVAGPGEAISKNDTVKDHDAKPPQKEKQADGRSSKNKPKSTLNAAVRSFIPSRAASTTSIAKLNPTAQSFTVSVPSSPSMSAAVITQSVDGNQKGHAKKPSLPGQPTGIDKRFITPAEQVVDPTNVSQPGPPTKEKKTAVCHGPLPDRTGGKPELPLGASSKPVPAMPVAAEKMTPIKKKAAEVVSSSPPPVTHDNFPTLGEAANTVVKKRTTSTVKAGVLVVPTASQSVVPTTGKTDTTANAALKPDVSHQRSVTAPTKALQPRQKPTEVQDPEGGSAWQTVGPARKNTGGTGRGHGGRGGRGGRFWHRSSGRGDRVAGAEERKGG